MLFKELLQSESKVLVHLLVDGVAVDRRVNVDFSQVPHQFTGGCLHWKNADFVTFEDASRVERDLCRECTDENEDEGMHFAQEVEVWCLGLNCRELTFLFPVALIPTCKKDYFLGQSTSTIKEVSTTIYNKFHA